MRLPPLPPSLLAAHPGLVVDPAPFGTGLINVTLRGRVGDREVVVQRLHPVFAGTVHHDIDRVTRHLASRGLVTPTLVPAHDGRLWVEDDEGRPWRLLTLVAAGRSYDKVPGAALAREAGALVGRFHAALADLEHDYVHVRPGVHDTPAHLDKLAAAIAAAPDHRLRDDVARLADPLLASRDTLLDPRAFPARHAHGDLKISNLLFDADDRGLCLVDLDTLGRMPLPFELGDALRSWCNLAAEDERARFDPTLFEAAVGGYAEGARSHAPRPEEVDAIARGTRTIALELAARFLADALEERYFGWDPARFPARGEHQLARARGQLALADDLAAREAELARAARRAFASGGAAGA